MPPSPWMGSSGGDVVEGNLVESVDLRPKTFEIFRLPARRDRRERAAMEGALEGDGAETLGVAVDELIAAGGLDCPLDRLGARIGEEHLVGEGRRHQPFGEAALAGNLVEVGEVPYLGGLLAECGHEMRVAVAQRVDGDACAEIEVALAIVGDQPAALAPFERQGRPRKGIEKRRTAHYMRLRNRIRALPQGGVFARARPKNEKAAQAAADPRSYCGFRP
jgi:hypothetical protein